MMENLSSCILGCFVYKWCSDASLQVVHLKKYLLQLANSATRRHFGQKRHVFGIRRSFRRRWHGSMTTIPSRYHNNAACRVLFPLPCLRSAGIIGVVCCSVVLDGTVNENMLSLYSICARKSSHTALITQRFALQTCSSVLMCCKQVSDLTGSTSDTNFQYPGFYLRIL